MKIIIARIFVGALSMALLLFGFYHFYRYQNSALHFETVLMHTVPRTLYGTGIAVRSEVLVESSGFGTTNFLHDDATRLGIRQIVAEVHDTAVGISPDYLRLQEIEREIERLTAAQDRNVNNMSTADAINRDIRDRLGALRTVSATGQAQDLERLHDDLSQLINRRRIAIGEDEDFSERLAVLNNERRYLNTPTFGSAAHSVVRAPVPGLFSRVYDGYETLITPAAMRRMSIDDFVGLIDYAPELPIGYTGRMVTSEVWFFAVPLNLHHAEWISRGQRVEMEFDSSGRRVPATVYDIVFGNRDDIVVAIFRSNHMSRDLINLRVNDVVVYSMQHTGIRVNNNAIHFRETPDGGVERGVYVLDGNILRFRSIHPIYENPHFLLSDPNPQIIHPTFAIDEDDENFEPRRLPQPVRQFDLVVTSGVDLFDGRPIR